MNRFLNQARAIATIVEMGRIYCPMCTHTVDAEIVRHAKHSISRPGQKCPRCSASLDAGYILRAWQAA